MIDNSICRLSFKCKLTIYICICITYIAHVRNIQNVCCVVIYTPILILFWGRIRVMAFDATFNNITVI